MQIPAVTQAPELAVRKQLFATVHGLAIQAVHIIIVVDLATAQQPPQQLHEHTRFALGRLIGIVGTRQLMIGGQVPDPAGCLYRSAPGSRELTTHGRGIHAPLPRWSDAFAPMRVLYKS